MSNITFPLVVFDRQHLVFFLSRCHAINYLRESQVNQVFICDATGKILSYELDDNNYSKIPQLELMDNVCVCKGILLEKLRHLWQGCEVSTPWIEELSVTQLISLAYDSF